EAREEDRLVEVAPLHTRRSLGPRQDALEHPDTVLICVQLEATTDEKAIGVKRDPADDPGHANKRQGPGNSKAHGDKY
ncbi:hypothetical protein DJ532_15395, partial [Sulfolobus sp. A20-N-F8]